MRRRPAPGEAIEDDGVSVRYLLNEVAKKLGRFRKHEHTFAENL